MLFDGHVIYIITDVYDSCPLVISGHGLDRGATALAMSTTTAE
jgi:hypothetical protein